MSNEDQIKILAHFLNKAWSRNSRQTAISFLREVEPYMLNPYRRRIILQWNIVREDTIYPSQSNLIELKKVVNEYIDFISKK